MPDLMKTKRQWFPTGSKERDLRRDLDFGYWAEIGPGGGGWSWTILNNDKGGEVAGGPARDAAHAMTLVAAWEGRNITG